MGELEDLVTRLYLIVLGILAIGVVVVIWLSVRDLYYLP